MLFSRCRRTDVVGEPKPTARATARAVAAAPKAMSAALGSDAPYMLPVATKVQLPDAMGSQTATCFTIDDLLSSDECQRLIDMSEGCSYEPALVNVGMGQQMLMTDTRKSGRVIIDSKAAADKIWQRLQHLIPQAGNDVVAWSPVGLNERFRFLKYEPGDYFAPHRDGNYEQMTGPNRGDVSFMTLMLYLNEPTRGGETNFLTFRSAGDDTVRVMPRPGLALVFDHEILHEGATLLEGVKYCIRTDIMFRQMRRPRGT
eukprot:2729779-Prymnesium_polylepis.1